MDNVIVVASGKGGTGKSTVCICLSVALVKQGKRVLLIDCDCGMRGLDIMLDMEQDIIFDASDAVCGNCTFGEAVYKSKKTMRTSTLWRLPLTPKTNSVPRCLLNLSTQ